jgi:organic hydroperoxide reductase OsmC/OhrA
MTTLEETATAPVEEFLRRANTTYRVEVAGDPPRSATERAVYTPEVAEPFLMGVRPSYEAAYGAKPGQFAPRATTVDVFVGAVTSCMLGTYALGLEARGIAIAQGELSAEAVSTLATERSGVTFVERIDIRMTTTMGEEHHAAMRKVARVFEKGCILSQTLAGSRCTVAFELVLD